MTSVKEEAAAKVVAAKVVAAQVVAAKVVARVAAAMEVVALGPRRWGRGRRRRSWRRRWGRRGWRPPGGGCRLEPALRHSWACSARCRWIAARRDCLAACYPAAAAAPAAGAWPRAAAREWLRDDLLADLLGLHVAEAGRPGSHATRRLGLGLPRRPGSRATRRAGGAVTFISCDALMRSRLTPSSPGRLAGAFTAFFLPATAPVTCLLPDCVKRGLHRRQ